MKQIEYDKKRVMSTVILGIIMIPLIVFTVILTPVTVHSLADGTSGLGEVIAITFGLIFAFIGESLVLVVSGIGLPFAIANRKSTLKPVRVISYVMDGLYSAMAIIALVKIILLFCGV